jgi:SAM-dependent methyltransferase
MVTTDETVIAQNVIAHYSRGNIEEQLLGIVTSAGKDPERFLPADLQGADQMHVGGAVATSHLAAGAGIGAGTRVLDIGSGMGGVARHVAQEFGATVHGVDLTPEFVAVAESMTRRTGLAGEVAFSVGSGTALPVADDSFDVALMIHVGMNIRDKDRVFAEAARTLRPGGVFAIYDVMLMGGDVETYPLPWAADSSESFLQPPLAYSDALGQAGFDVDSETNRRELGMAFLERALAGQGPVGLAGPPLANLLAAFKSGLLAPIEIYAHLP